MNNRLAFTLALPLALVAATHAVAALPAVPGQPDTAPAGTVAYGSVHSLPQELKDTLPKDGIGKLKPGEAQWHEEDAQRFANYPSDLLDSSATDGKVNVHLAKIQETALAHLQYEGLIPGGPTRDGPWTSVTRVFKRADGYPVFLLEYDFVADGGSVTVMKELINAKVGQTPATLFVRHSGDGRAITELTWTTNKKVNRLSTWGDLVKIEAGSPYDQKWLLDIAGGLAD